MEHWRKAGLRGIRRITAAEAAANPGLVRGGLVFVMSTGQGTGHMGFVERAAGGKLVTIEGNTNDGGSREGIGVFRRRSAAVPPELCGQVCEIMGSSFRHTACSAARARCSRDRSTPGRPTS